MAKCISFPEFELLFNIVISSSIQKYLKCIQELLELNTALHSFNGTEHEQSPKKHK